MQLPLTNAQENCLCTTILIDMSRFEVILGPCFHICRKSCFSRTSLNTVINTVGNVHDQLLLLTVVPAHHSLVDLVSMNNWVDDVHHAIAKYSQNQDARLARYFGSLTSVTSLAEAAMRFLS